MVESNTQDFVYAVGVSPRIDKGPTLEIPKATYEEAACAKVRLLALLSIEERYDMLMHNYEEFESQLLLYSLKHIIYADADWHTSIEQMRDINRRLNNLLSSCRLYIDQSKRILSATFGKESSEYLNYDKFRKDLHSKTLSYRLMEELRNVQQHKDLTIKSQGPSYQKTRNDAKAPVAVTITPVVTRDFLLSDGDISNTLEEEIRDLPERIDLKLHVREYVRCMSEIQGHLRDFLKAASISWEESFVSVRTDYLQKFASDKITETTPISLIKYADSAKSQVLDEDYLPPEIIPHRQKLEETNRILHDLTNIFPTGQDSERIKSERNEQSDT